MLKMFCISYIISVVDFFFPKIVFFLILFVFAVQQSLWMKKKASHLVVKQCPLS